MNTSAYFITPTLSLGYPGSIYTSAFVDTYLLTQDDYNCTDEECNVETKFMYFLYKDTIDDKLREHFSTHVNLAEVIIPGTGYILFKMRIPEEYSETVVAPFIEGAYSQIDRTYVDKHFPATDDTLAANRAILYKSDKMRKYWEDKIGEPLPEGAEVWPKPDITKETYFYEHSI